MFQLRLSLPLENGRPFVLVSIFKMTAAYSGKSRGAFLVPVINIFGIIGMHTQNSQQ